jgi:hypothetical protein
MSEPIYKVRDWQKHFENNRSRTVENLRWVCVPNKHDGEGYATVMEQENAAELFAAWVLILQVASKCQERGTLMREDGTPMTAKVLAIKTRAPQHWFENALNFLTYKVKWMECHPSDGQVSPDCHPTVTQVTKKEVKGMEGKEENGKTREARKSSSSESDLSEVALKISTLVPEWSPHFSHIERVSLSDNSAKWESLTESDWQTLKAWYEDSSEASKFRAGKTKLIESPDEEVAKARRAGITGGRAESSKQTAPEGWQSTYATIDPTPVYLEGEYCAPDWDRLSPSERSEVLSLMKPAA